MGTAVKSTSTQSEKTREQNPQANPFETAFASGSQSLKLNGYWGFMMMRMNYF